MSEPSPSPDPSPATVSQANGSAVPWVLALHSSSDTFGVAAQPLGGGGSLQSRGFPLGRSLSNQLLECVEAVLPASQWSRLARLAVATGPGGFTGTRLSVVLARTLAQQLAVPLDGVGSFALIAQRLLGDAAAPATGPFWLVQELPRRGLVAGLYAADPTQTAGVIERLTPRLYGKSEQLAELAAAPQLPAVPVLPADAELLLVRCQAAAAADRPAPWQPVLPLYPTSPVEGL
ncbi:tRNA (adenosine(37)-N6)-threonylcarbamoyltransferase complex dimerization subunit type 1 TsaB [Synechococcus sp. CBW1002]|jgi:tRNA threonylcarbamoyladenosine biosynthesis protein TsaB|uniref:tRNA (adenosine(37)-N6)-threonylcarbamoyltransferase complex dimerization subunit type 1 TsaB n=1 Tax=Synechococcus sp. CBW1002 TaxID=1353134 RepID=UPI0018CDCD09|nr:tRNA (adenosine(37)-N6)-threonylcarbamoyltransferase complex dimerization subunit type 1 TsaB [Synechococcus sp. CBW1002]QPN60346.1 tRNA (adenosine(37)-N6)-threonylcarbamoyltransferase complex dimerization subunit type 1 TsaB [Synechococcus sp. CBW1002]